MISIIKLIRPQQWVKNFFIFLPLFFDGKILDFNRLLGVIVMFFVFSLAASGVYCFNDVHDIELDKLHPYKKFRPVASGAISKSQAFSLMLFCVIASFLLLFFYNWQSGVRVYLLLGVITFYLLMNIAYCIWLKQMAIVDVFIIAVGFVLRVVAGGLSACVYLSHWIVLMTFLLALFLAFAKRRNDVTIYENTGVKTRKNIARYNLPFLNQAIGIVASITMVCYIMYTVSPEVVARFDNSYLYLSSIFVLAGLIRYLHITIVDSKSGSPTRILMNDRFIQATILGWILTFVIIIYFL